MHDNTLARALQRQGVDIQLIPTYTPIRTDEEDVSLDCVFFGGINVFLEQKLPLYRYLPASLTRFLDRPGLIRWATSRPAAINAKFLGAMTVSMLRGTAGKQRREIEKLCQWLGEFVQPQLVVFTNMLISACAERIKAELSVPVLVTLQGDDAFLESLPNSYRTKALNELRRLVAVVDGFLVHSNYYAEFMQDYVGIPESKCHRVPLGLDLDGFRTPGQLSQGASGDAAPQRPRRIGYLARLSPEKGLHILVDAFLELRRRPEMQDVQLWVAGWLSEDHRQYAEREFGKIRDAGLSDAFQYAGAVDRQAKLEFLEQLDVLSVPTTYREPKGLFVLEALASGVPVVQPAHGAFGEMLDELGGGRLVPPNDPSRLADELGALLSDRETLRQLGLAGAQAVHTRRNADAMAEQTWEVFQQFLSD
jgi:glycosyltransferase involved in cell wall biosynthesis